MTLPLRLLLGTFVSLLTFAGCSSSTAGEDALIDDQETRSSSVAETTTTLPPLPPTIEMPASARAEIGQVFSDAVIARDPNGDETTLTFSPVAPDGFATVVNPRGRVIGFEWRPDEAGEWTIDVTATDAGGLTSERQLTLISRHPRSKDLLMAMGDSVAAGFGRDRSDFAGSDACFRSEGDAYGVLAADALIDAGALAANADVVVVACAGANSRTMQNVPVNATDRNGDVVGEPASQVDAAVSANPTIITLTVGSGDISLFDADAVTTPNADNDPLAAIDQFVLDQRLQQFDRNLRSMLASFTSATDAHVVITTWYDPTASIPNGVDDCTGACMSAVMTSVVTQLNDTILAAVAVQAPGRVSVARLDGDADVWEAKNGIGPDALRDSLGPLQGLVDPFTGGSSATCADTGGPAQDLISSLDCAHPNGDGHREIAAIVANTLLEI